jgi:hypothetical protein
MADQEGSKKRARVEEAEVPDGDADCDYLIAPIELWVVPTRKLREFYAQAKAFHKDALRYNAELLDAVTSMSLSLLMPIIDISALPPPEYCVVPRLGDIEAAFENFIADPPSTRLRDDEGWAAAADAFRAQVREFVASAKKQTFVTVSRPVLK